MPNVLRRRPRRAAAHRHHEVDVVAGAAGDRGKFENLNALLERHPATGYDWLLVVDDDVALPRGFLDAFVFLAERFDLALAQPAHRWRSHAAWAVTRRRPGIVVARDAVRRDRAGVRAARRHLRRSCCRSRRCAFGWGLDAHWSAVAAQRAAGASA